MRKHTLQSSLRNAGLKIWQHACIFVLFRRRSFGRNRISSKYILPRRSLSTVCYQNQQTIKQQNCTPISTSNMELKMTSVTFKSQNFLIARLKWTSANKRCNNMCIYNNRERRGGCQVMDNRLKILTAFFWRTFVTSTSITRSKWTVVLTFQNDDGSGDIWRLH